MTATLSDTNARAWAIRQLADNGLSDTAIARLLNLPPWQVAQLRYAHDIAAGAGVGRPRGDVTVAAILAIGEAHQQEALAGDIAEIVQALRLTGAGRRPAHLTPTERAAA